jgi:hypothetical protein
VFVLVALTVPMPLALRVVTLVFLGGGALVFIASIATRRVALRVDASGVTLGGSPGRYHSTTVLIRWAGIKESCSGASRCPAGVPSATSAWPAIRAPARSQAERVDLRASDKLRRLRLERVEPAIRNSAA